MVHSPEGLDRIERTPNGDGPNESHSNRGSGNGNVSNTSGSPQATTIQNSVTTTTDIRSSTVVITLQSQAGSTTTTIAETHLTSAPGSMTTFQPAADLNNTSTTTPSTSSTFKFSQPANAITCQSFTVLWSINDTAVIPITLSIGPSPPVQPDHSLVLATDVPSNAQIYIWGVVNVVEGSYVFSAMTSEGLVLSHSSPFIVSNGTDINCLQATSSSILSHSESNTPTPHPVQATPGHSPRVGDIVGITLGAIAGIIFLLAAFIFPRLWRRALPSPKKHRPYLLY